MAAVTQKISPQKGTERTVMVVSLAGTVLFAVAGIVIFLLTDARSVLVDGVFTLIGAVTAVITLRVLRVADDEPRPGFPYGLRQARPMLELFKALLLIGLLAGAVLDAVTTMLAGGRELAGPMITIYAGGAAVGSLLVALVMLLTSRRERSSIVRLEIKQWFQDAALSAAIGIAFAAVTFVPWPWLQRNANYLDQVLVVAIALAMTPALIAEVRRSGRELLLGAPEGNVRSSIEGSVRGVFASATATVRNLAVISSGGLIFVDVEATVASRSLKLDEAEGLRQRLHAAVTAEHPLAICSVSFYPSSIT